MTWYYIEKILKTLPENYQNSSVNLIKFAGYKINTQKPVPLTMEDQKEIKNPI